MRRRDSTHFGPRPGGERVAHTVLEELAEGEPIDHPTARAEQTSLLEAAHGGVRRAGADPKVGAQLLVLGFWDLRETQADDEINRLQRSNA